MRQGVTEVAAADTIGTGDTLGQCFLRNCQGWGPKRVALRHKRYGIWNEFTWAESYQRVRDFALGLLCLGLEHGDRVALLGDIEPELYWGMFAIWSTGAVTVGGHVDALQDEVRYLVDHSDSAFLLVRDQEQVDKLLRIKDDLPKVKQVIWWDPRGMRNYDDPWLLSFESVCEMGKRHAKEHPQAFEEAVARTKGDDVCTIYYTSGTTGVPKGCCHTHRSLMNFTDTALHVLEAGPDDDTVPHFSVGSMGEPLLGSVAHLRAGLRLNIPEEPETVKADMREIAPAFVLWMPRQWENIASTIQINVGEAGPLQRFCYGQFLKVGYRYAEFQYQGQRPSLLWRALHFIGEQLVFRPVRDRVGLSQLKRGINSSYTLGIETFQFLRALGMDIRQFYASTEQGITAAQTEGNIRAESVGVLMPGCEAMISPEGELLIKSRGLFAGYYKDPAASEKAMRDGWFHTGDAAHVDEQKRIFLFDRLSELGELASGAKYAPQFIEAQLRFGAHIRDAAALGGKGRDYVTVVITLDFQAAAKWAEKHGINYTTAIDLSQRDQLAEVLLGDIQRVNKILPRDSRISKFVVLHKEFDADEGELTRTRKLRRAFVESRYADMIEAMYAGEREVLVSALVTYQDGRTGTVTAGVKVRLVPAEG